MSLQVFSNECLEILSIRYILIYHDSLVRRFRDRTFDIYTGHLTEKLESDINKYSTRLNLRKLPSKLKISEVVYFCGVM